MFIIIEINVIAITNASHMYFVITNNASIVKTETTCKIMIIFSIAFFPDGSYNIVKG